jgi:hypothetical protein
VKNITVKNNSINLKMQHYKQCSCNTQTTAEHRKSELVFPDERHHKLKIKSNIYILNDEMR